MSTATTAHALASAYLRKLAHGDTAGVQHVIDNDGNRMVPMRDVDGGEPLPARVIAQACLSYARGFDTPHQSHTAQFRAWFLVDQTWRHP